MVSNDKNRSAVSTITNSVAILVIFNTFSFTNQVQKLLELNFTFNCMTSQCFCVMQTVGYHV